MPAGPSTSCGAVRPPERVPVTAIAWFLGEEPYRAFAGISGVELWHWPNAEQPGAKMHAKLAVADRRVLLITSANLTQSGVSQNIEAGLLICGGTAPQRAAEHVDALRASGDLIRLT
jgi:phosphatidylserine/phosphatidylglycerophosphate/cardiolipin synthase-like enzyme